MACSPERYANLPIAPHYKKGLIDFCNDPKNDAACAQLCESSDEEIVQSIAQIEGQLKDWQENGIPKEISEGNPELSSEIDSPLNGMKSADAEPMDQGIGALPTSQMNPNIPPGQLADVPMPMDVPSPPPQTSVGAYRHGGFVNAPRFFLGGLKEALGGNSGILGAVVGGALAFYTGGMSLMAGAALGSAAGTYADTGDLGAAFGAGITAYGVGSAGAGIASGTMGGMAKGAGKLAAMSGEPPPQQSPMPMIGQAPQQQAPPRQGGARIPGRRPSPIGEGIGQLSSLPTGAAESQPIGIQPGTAALATPPDPMDAYYQCVMTQGEENCQLPQGEEMPAQPSQTSPVNLEPAQYAQNYQGGGEVNGLGTETSDSQPAWLSDNEFVMTADAVRGMGGGDIDMGASKMYDLMAELEQRGQ